MPWESLLTIFSERDLAKTEQQGIPQWAPNCRLARGNLRLSASKCDTKLSLSLWKSSTWQHPRSEAKFAICRHKYLQKEQNMTTQQQQYSQERVKSRKNGAAVRKAGMDSRGAVSSLPEETRAESLLEAWREGGGEGEERKGRVRHRGVHRSHSLPSWREATGKKHELFNTVETLSHFCALSRSV